MSVTFEKHFTGPPADVQNSIAASDLPADLKTYLSSIAGCTPPDKEGSISIDVAGRQCTTNSPGETRLDHLIAHG